MIEILDFNSYVKTYKQVRIRVDYRELFKYVRILNEKLHQKKTAEDRKAILFSGVFNISYPVYDNYILN